MFGMEPRDIVLVFLTFCLISVGVTAQNPDIGKILIGAQRNDTTDIKFSEYVITSGITLNIPFTAVVYSGVDGSVTNKRDAIRVRCENQFAGQPGYTQMTFFDRNLGASVAEDVVIFSFPTAVVAAGRPSVVRCYGLSNDVITGALQCPATNDQSVTQPQFCRETSMSSTITITLTNNPSLSICEKLTVVPIITPGTPSQPVTTTGILQVTLSEPVRGANVTVTCVTDNSAISGCTRSNSVTFTTTSIEVDQVTASVEYRITHSNEETCLGVLCSAQSERVLPVGNYFQYQSAIARDTAMIRSFSPEVKMEPQFMNVYNTSFQSILYMDVNTDIDVPFQCQASVVKTLTEAEAKVSNPDCSFISGTTTPATTTTSTTPAPTTLDPNATTTIPIIPTPPVDPSSPWIAMDSSFIVKPSTNYYIVRTQRLLSVIAPVQEIIVTTCCSTYSSLTSYRDLNATTVSVAILDPLRNNTGGITSGLAGNERFIIKPAYREIAPCPCDLTYQTCDVSCCCDGDCTDTQKETFSSCIPGVLGGLDPGPDLRSCKSGQFPKDDWFPMMCVQFESNALLGDFYSHTEPKLETTFATDAKLAESLETDVYTYQETEARYSDLDQTPGYKKGSNILTVSSQGIIGSLPLPRQLSSGHCLDLAPVQFLQDSASSCPSTLTPTTCIESPLFNAESFVQPSTLYFPTCPKASAISSTGSSDSQVVEVKVNYHCAGDLNAYVKSSQVFSDLVKADTVYTFPPGLEALNCSDPCNETVASAGCLNINAGLEEPATDPLPPRCFYDTGYAMPPAPVYDSATGRCEHVVLEVRYHLSWAGQEVTGITADVVVGNLTLPSSQSIMIGQKFSAAFSHNYTGPANQTDNYLQIQSEAFQRSGRPGYDLGKPVATGCRSTNATTGQALPVDQDPTKQMAIWSPGADGLCKNAKRRFLTFGDDMQSSCSLYLAFDDIASCDSLKSLIVNHLNVLMPSGVIGRYGYNNPDYANMWIDVLREDPFAPEEEMVTTTIAPTTTTPIATTTDAGNSTNTTFDPLSLRRGVCQDILSGVHLEVMYAETGQSDGYPLLEIIGASVRFSKTNWSMPCTGPSSPARCQNNSAATQPFLLSSSVQYTRVSANTPEKRILFYEIHKKDKCDTDTCYRFYEDFDTSVCHYDTCWQELVYPLTAGYVGYESVHYTRAFTLLFIVFVLGYIAVTKPWK